jgi:hypothetical protein
VRALEAHRTKLEEGVLLSIRRRHTSTDTAARALAELAIAAIAGTSGGA